MDEFHADETRVIADSDVVDSYDVRMGQLSRNDHFFAKAFQDELLGCISGAEHLYSDQIARQLIGSLVDRAHSAPADQLQDFVTVRTFDPGRRERARSG